MATERISIVVSTQGTRTVKRDLENLATSADHAGDEAAELQRRLRAISPTAELAQTMRQMQALRTAMKTGGATSDWPRRPIQEANAELFTAIGHMNTVKANMRDQTPWAATRQFEQADNELASIQNRLRLVDAAMARRPSGPTLPLNGPIGPQQPFMMGLFADDVDRFNSVGRPAVSVANDLAGGVNNVSGAVRSAHKPFILLNRYVGAFGGLIAAQQLMQLADSATVVRNRVDIVSDSVLEAESAVRSLYDIARRTRTPIEEMAGLYQKGMMASEELGVSQQEVLQFVEAVGMGLAVQGSAANTARGALTQLSQAIGTDIVRAEEFNSILEGAYPIALAAARGIDEAGGSVARLRRMVIEGEVSSEQFFNAIMSQYPMIAGMFEKTSPTISQAFTILQNSLKDYIDTSDEAQAISEGVASSIILIADNIAPMADVLFALGIAWTVGFAVSTAGRIADMASSVGALKTGLSAIAPLVGATGPIGVGFALIASGAFLMYQNTEKAADKINRLREVMDNSVGALQGYNEMIQIAKQEQGELGGVINLTTEAMLRQSRAELQTSLAALGTEIRDMEREISGGGLNPFNLDNIRTALSEMTAMGAAVGRFNPDREDGLLFRNEEIENLYDTLVAVRDGTGDIKDFYEAIERARGAGPEIGKAVEDLGLASDALEQGMSDQSLTWMTQAKEQLTGIAELIGGFDTELAALEDFDPSNFMQTRALEDLALKLEDLAQAGSLVRGSSWISDTADLLKALQDAKDLEASMHEALGANAARLQELATEAENFRQPVAGAEAAASGINDLVNEISFSPLEEGARGFANQMVRAANAAAAIGNTQLSTGSTGPSVVEASYSPNGEVTRASTGGLGLMELNNGGSFTVGGTGGVDQNLVAFWASRGENVLVSQPDAAGESTVGQANRLGQTREYVAILKEINSELDKRYSALTDVNQATGNEAEMLDAVNMAKEAGIILSQEDTALIRERIGALGELEQELSQMQQIGNAVFNNMSSAIDTFIETGKFSFKDFARSVISDLSSIGTTTFIGNPMKSFFGGILEGIIPSFQMPAYNEGADFTVGGSGGVDKNVVAFKASRGERVQVTPAGQNTGTAGATNIVFNIQTPDAGSFRKSEAQIVAKAQRLISRGQRNS